jgi:hypothetical protein
MVLIERRNAEIFGALTPRERQQLGIILDKLIVAHVPDEAAED